MWRCLKKSGMRVLTPSLILAIVLPLLLLSPLKAQSVIGMNKQAVKDLVKENYKEFRPDQLVVNQRFNYLKFVNGRRTRTWIFYFTEDNYCKSTKLVCDYGDYDKILEELNNSYEKAGESRWKYLSSGDTIHVSLNRQEWYFTVREARKK